MSAATVPLPRRTYITMRPFYNDIFNYTVSVINNTNVGELGPIPGISPGACPKGHFLRETGRKLYPGVNDGVGTYMVSVFDYASGIHGFIDPNSPAFTVQNSDRPYSIDSAGFSPNTADTGVGQSDQGPPVYTKGEIIGKSNLTISGYADISGDILCDFGNITATSGGLFVKTTVSVSDGNISAGNGNIVASNGSGLFNLNVVASNGDISAGYGNIVASNGSGLFKAGVVASNGGVSAGVGNIVASNGSGLFSLGVVASNGDITAINGNLNIQNGGLILNARTSGIANMASGVVSAGFKRVTVTGVGCTANSLVFLTNRNQLSPGSVYSAEGLTNGSFNIVSNNINDTSLIQWMVVN
jgi:hypothetical protein